MGRNLSFLPVQTHWPCGFMDDWIDVFTYTCREYRESWFLICCKIRAINVSELHGWHWNLKYPSGESDSKSGSNLNLKSPYQSLRCSSHTLTVSMLWQSVLYYGGLECRSAWGESWLPVGIPHRPIGQHLQSELRLPPCRKYTRACSCSYKYMRTSAIKTRHDAIAKCKYFILWAGSWIKFIKTVWTKKIEASLKSCLKFELRNAGSLKARLPQRW